LICHYVLNRQGFLQRSGRHHQNARTTTDFSKPRRDKLCFIGCVVAGEFPLLAIEAAAVDDVGHRIRSVHGVPSELMVFAMLSGPIGIWVRRERVFAEIPLPGAFFDPFRRVSWNGRTACSGQRITLQSATSARW
jgi:hypothetical protein